jgi:hypothetical protein
MEHGVEVVSVMTAGTGGGSGVRSDSLFDIIVVCAATYHQTRHHTRVGSAYHLSSYT